MTIFRDLRTQSRTISDCSTACSNFFQGTHLCTYVFNYGYIGSFVTYITKTKERFKTKILKSNKFYHKN